MGDSASGTVTTFRDGVLDLWSDGRGKVLTAVAGGWFLSLGVRMIYPVMLPYLRTAYGLDLTSAGLLVTVLFLAYALGQFPGGVLADRFGERSTLTASAVISAVMLALVTTAGSTVVLFVATALFGFGTALYAIGRYTVLSRLYTDRLGAANGVTAAAQDAGQSVLPPIASVLAATFLWTFGFGFVIPLFLLCAASLWLVIPVRSESTSTDGSGLSRDDIRSLRPILRQPSVVYATTAFVLGLIVWQAFTSFFPTYLIERKELSTPVASLLFGAFFALGIVIKPLAGAAYDRFGIRHTLIIVGSCPAIALVVLPLVDGFWPIAVITALMSILLGFGPVLEPSVLHSLPEELRGTGFGIIRSVGFTIGATSPFLFGAAADRGFFDESFVVLAAFAAGMIVIAFRIPEN